MAVRKIRILGDPVLRKRAEEVEAIDDNIRVIVQDMHDSMYQDGGVGLAAPQIGESLRIIVLDGDVEKYGERIIAIINPVITWSEGKVEEEEGCLSIPGIREKVERIAKVRVKGFDAEGGEIEFDADGLLSRAIQHEIDHLDGVLFIDRVGPLQREIILKQWKKIKEDIDVKERA